jgi:predicted permease
MACLPTAINALLLAVRFDARPDLVGNLCLVTSLLSPLSMLVVLAWRGATVVP